jgi:hypothetical protein
VFRVFPLRIRIIGTERDPKHVTRPRLKFAGDVFDGQRVMGCVEMTPDEHLVWKWVCFGPLPVTLAAKEPSRYPGGMDSPAGGI